MSWHLVIALALLGCTQVNGKTKVRVGTFASQPWFYGFKHALFDDEDYEFQVSPQSSGGRILAQVSAGDIDISEIGSAPLALGLAREVNMSVVYIAYPISMSECLAVRTGGDVKSPLDLKGKKIYLPTLSTAHYLASFFLQQFGLTGETELVHTSPADIKKGWDDGTIDNALVWPTALTHMLSNGGQLLLTGQDAVHWNKPVFEAYIVSNKFLAAHPKAVDRFVHVMSLIADDYSQGKYDEWAKDDDRLNSIVEVTFGADKINDAEATKAVLDELNLYDFVSRQGSASKTWLDNTATYLTQHIDFFVGVKQLPDPSSNIGQVLQNSVYADGAAKSIAAGGTVADLVSATIPTPTKVPSSRCDGVSENVLADASGMFSDGHGSNSPYIAGMTCSWRISISGNDNLPVELTFSFFALESGFDWVHVYDAVDETILVGSFTGQQVVNQEMTVTHTGAVKVLFQSDGVNAHQPFFYAHEMGFSASYKQASSCTQASDCQVADGYHCLNSVCKCDHSAQSKCTERCQGTQVLQVESSGKGKIFAGAPLNRHCKWNIVLQDPGQVIQLTFESLSLEKAFDFIIVSDKATKSVISKLTGTIDTHQTIYTSKSDIVLELNTDQIGLEKSGFVVEYSAVTESAVCASSCSNHGTCSTDGNTCVCEPGYFGADCSSTSCKSQNRVGSDHTGVLLSNHPDLAYPADSTCGWVLKPTTLKKTQGIHMNGTHSHAFELTWNDFSLEPAGDYVTVLGRDDDTSSWTEIVKYSGKSSRCISHRDCHYRGSCDNSTCSCHPQFLSGDCSVPKKLVVDKKFVKVELNTDKNNQGQVFSGFNVSYASVFPCLNSCSGHGQCFVGECTCDDYYQGDDCGQKIRIEHYVQALTRDTVTILSMIMVVFSLISLVLIVHLRRKAIIRAASWKFCVLILAGLVQCFITSWLLVTKPSATNHLCTLRQWFGVTGANMVVLPLLAKTWRIVKVMNGNNSLKKVVLRDKDILKGIIALGFPFIIILVVGTANGSYQYTETLDPLDPSFVGISCETGKALNILTFGYGGILLLWGVSLSSQAKNMPSQFNEASAISITITTTFLCSCFTLLLQISITKEVAAAVLIQAVGFWASAAMAWGLLFIPKFYYLHTGTGVESLSSSRVTPTVQATQIQ